MSELEQHFARMQGMMRRYLVPDEPYEPVAGHNGGNRDALFIADMLYMLDGPEQRACQPAYQAALIEDAARCRWESRRPNEPHLVPWEWLYDFRKEEEREAVREAQND